MKTFLIPMLLVLSSLGCTTLKPVEVPAEELQRRLIAGELVEPGDRVRLVTADETVHKFRVTEIDFEQYMVLGPDNQVSINEIVALETREISMGRTALLTGGVGVGVAALIAIAIVPAIALGGG